ncbi:helix-turn-helix transcriptional regulator [Kineosporia sp. J2-2]|uniref:Helix-turn-helix transcriptional regulator n=1 Tax=Kineosporia corallincola TaxID=2835133 RepID=A0ABS5TAP8_9ACTN|nr:helix-turn-helix domain-containing protein [Kineosporia corallincola]MBT0768111.1 helix-turn-helix transcriptional regulator [Kineosporia corallincola]
MRVTTVRDIGALVRAARRAQGMTQAVLADRLGVGRDWIVRLESGQPRLETQKVLDALVVLGLALDVEQQPAATASASRAEPEAPPPETPQASRKSDATRSSRRTTAEPATRSSRAKDEGPTDPFVSLFAKRAR